MAEYPGTFDMIIRNGRLLDPRGGLDQVRDLGICGRKIAAVGDLSARKAQINIDAGGCIVTPGLIDFHAHAAYGLSDFSMPADLVQIPNGVTKMVDAGSTGCANFEAFYRNNVLNSVLTIKTFLNVASMGQVTHRINENTDPDLFDVDRISMLCEKYKDQIIGLKLRQSRDIVGDLGLKPLEGAVELGRKVGLPLSVHITDSPGEVRDTLERIRPGDIFCHMFHQKGKTILDQNGKVLPEVWEAKERGILFELGHGAFNFSGKIARAAIEQGFLPDIISSDLSLLSAFKEPTYSFSYILSELLNLGMRIEDIIARCTDIPGRLMGYKQDGFLKEGETADIAVLRIVDKEVHYLDRYQNKYEGTKMIKAELTVKEGRVVHRQYDFLQ
ncbi:MAG: amidohydrolase family protein [Eubacterium sp.]|nr:amidohydrolase family protein [Eubacterium sp.]